MGFELEGPARGVTVALERARDLVTAVVEEEAAEAPREVAADERDIADPRDFLELMDTRFVAAFK